MDNKETAILITSPDESRRIVTKQARGCFYIVADRRQKVKEKRTMLKTNSKQAAENVRAYICDNFDFSNYADYTETKEPETFPEIAAFILATFRNEKYSRPEDFRYYHGIEREAFADWCAGLPSVLDTCYFYNRSAVDDLAGILEETEAEKAKYTEADAEKLLTALIYRELTKGDCK